MSWFKKLSSIPNTESERGNNMQHNYAQIAENYLANEVLPKLKNTTTGQPFENMSFDKDDIISGAMERALETIRNPQTWEGKILTIPQIKSIVDKIVGSIIKKIMYPMASKKMNNPQEMTFTDAFGKDVSGEIVDPVSEKKSINELDPDDLKEDYNLIISLLDKLNPEYKIILKHLLLSNSYNSWRETLNKLDQEIGRKITRKDVNNLMVDLEEMLDQTYSYARTRSNENESKYFYSLCGLMKMLIITLKKSMHYIGGQYYRVKHNKTYAKTFNSWFKKANDF